MTGHRDGDMPHLAVAPSGISRQRHMAFLISRHYQGCSPSSSTRATHWDGLPFADGYVDPEVIHAPDESCYRKVIR
jgi:hypothetical protein